MTDLTITVRTRTPFRPWRAVYVAVAQILVIGVGVFTGSSAMQWAGFLLLALMLFALLTSENSKTTGLSFSEARAKLDELEAEQSN